MMSAAARRAVMLGGGLAGALACHDFAPLDATVSFRLDAPLCSSSLPVQLAIDGQVVAVDTFVVNFSATPNHVTSAAFPVQPGNHLLAARVVGGYVWPDTTVSVAAGSAFTRVLPFYCS